MQNLGVGKGWEVVKINYSREFIRVKYYSLIFNVAFL